MKRYDLHTHSNVSDGVLPPDDVVRRARASGVEGIALTDHDSTGGLAAAIAAGEREGVEVLAGCEVSAELNKKSVHILGYFMDLEHPRWVEELRWIRDERVVRAEKMVEKLRELGVPITMEMVRRNAGDGESIARPHIAAAMVELGIVPTTVDAFTEEWIADNGRAYVPKKVMGPEDTVRLIVEAGGVAVMAHPIWIDRDLGGGAEELIASCADAGMAGLEIDHPDLDAEARIKYGKIAERYGLIRTGSSDFHGNRHGGGIGENSSSEETVAALRAAAGGPA